MSQNECFNECDDELKENVVGIGPMDKTFDELRRNVAIGTFVAQPTSRKINDGLKSSLPKIKHGLGQSFRAFF